MATIDNENIKFERNYKFNNETKLIEFNTILTIKEENKIIENTIELLPIRKSDIEFLLQEAGFININFYGNFKKSTFKLNDIPLIVEANSL